MERRTFLKLTGTAGILAAHRAPAFAQGTKLHVTRWVDFIPACDVELKKQAGEASKALGAEVQFEFINANDLQPRITAAIQSQSGSDIFHLLHNWAHLYDNGLVDVSDVAEWQAKEQGGFYAQSEQDAKVNGRFMALPHSIVPGLIAYRKSWFDEIGVKTFPKTYEDLRKVATTLKKKGHPYGQTLGHTFGDAPAWAYPLMWNFGGTETDKSGKTAIDSKGSVEAVKFMAAVWKDAGDEGGMAWDDSNKQWQKHPLWSTIDEPMKGFRTAPDNSRTMGFAGPPNAKATEAYSKYVIVDMFAKGVQGSSPEDAVKWAAGELKKIYGG